MTAIAIEKLNAHYFAGAGGGPARSELDRILRLVLDDALEAAMPASPEHVCIRRVDVPVTLAVGARTDIALAGTWASAIAAGIDERLRAGGEDVARYGSQRHALLDMALGVAAHDLRREWAWRSLALWPARETDAPRALVEALVDDAAAIAPLLRAVADAGSLGGLGARLAAGSWEALAVAALRAAGSSPAAAAAALRALPGGRAEVEAAAAARDGDATAPAAGDVAPGALASGPDPGARAPDAVDSSATDLAGGIASTRPSAAADALAAGVPRRHGDEESTAPPGSPAATSSRPDRVDASSTSGRDDLAGRTDAARVTAALRRSGLAAALRAAGVRGSAAAALALAESDPALVAALGGRLAGALGAQAATAPAGRPAAARSERANERWAPGGASDRAASSGAGSETLSTTGEGSAPARPPDPGTLGPPSAPAARRDGASATDARIDGMTHDRDGASASIGAQPDSATASAASAAPRGPSVPAAGAAPRGPSVPAASAAPRGPSVPAASAAPRGPSVPAASAAPRRPSVPAAGGGEGDGAARATARDRDPARSASDGAGDPVSHGGAPVDGASEHGGQPRPDDDRLVPARARGESAYGGLVFALNGVVALDLAGRLALDLPDIELRAALHALALRLAPLATPRDPAALAFAGLPPDREPPPLPPASADGPIARAADDVAAWLARRLETDSLDLAGLMARRAEIVADPGWIEVHLRLGELDTAVRRGGLDLDPGHVPFLGCVLKIVYA